MNLKVIKIDLSSDIAHNMLVLIHLHLIFLHNMFILIHLDVVADLELETKLIAESVFVILSESFTDFRKGNGV